MVNYPQKILHWIDNEETPPAEGRFFEKINPATGEVLARAARGGRKEADLAIESASRAFESWAGTPAIKRADILREAVLLILGRKEGLAEIVALETGKSKKIALGEVDAALECGFFFAGEGRRFFGEVLQSSVLGRHVELIRQPAGLGVLITPFNNPASGVAWKLFPAILCGNAVVMKAHEDTPYVPIWFAKIFKEAGLPSGVLSVLQGFGPEVGQALVEDRRVRFISLTGSVKTGQAVIRAASERLAKVSVESGGKNPFVVCDDADLDEAATLAVASAFVDAGQRCAAASRIIVFDAVYDQFKKRFLERVSGLKVGAGEEDDYGAIINEKRMAAILKAVEGAVSRGAKILAGGKRMGERGYFIQPTVLENVDAGDELSQSEIFGPVAALYRAKDFEAALGLAGNSEFKLTSAIHTRSINRAQEFIRRHRTGVVRVNGPTFGSESHMPFGGLGLSGNGWREPGSKALDFYSEWKQISIDHNPSRL